MKLGKFDATTLPHRNAALQKEGANLIDDAGTLADRPLTIPAVAARSSNAGYWGMSGLGSNSRSLRILTHRGLNTMQSKLTGETLGAARFRMTEHPLIKVDYLEAGSSGPVVMLVHSGASGARMWRRLMEDLKEHFRVRAVNLFGYGTTPPWLTEGTQTLDDQARLVEAALPTDADGVYLVGHSLGGAIAMKTAARLGKRVGKLVLLEPNPFFLLAQTGRVDAFAEAMEMRNCIKKFGAQGDWATAGEKFADYWGNAGTWLNMSPARRSAFIEAIKPNFFEWDAMTNDATTAEQWATLLPRSTLLVYDPKTVLPIREIAILLRQSCPWWSFCEVHGVGHMGALTRPDMINPLVGSFLIGGPHK